MLVGLAASKYKRTELFVGVKLNVVVCQILAVFAVVAEME